MEKKVCTIKTAFHQYRSSTDDIHSNVTLDCEAWTPETGQVTLDCEAWTPETGQVTLDCEVWTPETGQVTLDCEAWTPETGQVTLDCEAWTPETEQVTLDCEAWTPETGQVTLDCEAWTPETGQVTLDWALIPRSPQTPRGQGGLPLDGELRGKVRGSLWLTLHHLTGGTGAQRSADQSPDQQFSQGSIF
ncbi:hypothetical protein NHX12_024487 [Muraenolepis orangiensis]|uniref:Uncharacterized protein n=1 Tax=Muraenolepis orangiensis TaxID=630683 RepID=A0A9Q0ISC8_9TELE|nr:hypothetical protein NHX12_024487 [Muraenolepis orangiensis]